MKLLEAIAFIPLLLQDRADELREEVDADRYAGQQAGIPPEDLARCGDLRLAWADLLDVIADPRRRR